MPRVHVPRASGVSVSSVDAHDHDHVHACKRIIISYSEVSLPNDPTCLYAYVQALGVLQRSFGECAPLVNENCTRTHAHDIDIDIDQQQQKKNARRRPLTDVNACMHMRKSNKRLRSRFQYI